MELQDILQERYKMKKYEIVYNNFVHEYYIAEYFIKNNRLLKYYIIDLTKKENDRLSQWDDMKSFQDFQETLLEADFFSSMGDERYNIYLIFIVSPQMNFFKELDIQNDFQYARKIILKDTEIEDFLLRLFPLKRKSGENDLSVMGVIHQKKAREELLQYAREGVRLFRKEFDIHNFVCQNNKKKKPSDIISLELLKSLSECMMFDRDMIRPQNEKKGKLDLNVLDIEDYNIKEIKQLYIEKFRHFQKPCKIPFRKVNLIYGDNGVGKTSILNAIELGITGYNQDANKDKEKDAEIKITCLNSKKEKVFLSYKRSNLTLSKKWYGIQAENTEEFNKFFTQYNYFDTSWASAFAIEAEERVNIKQLQKFLGIEDLKKLEEAVINLYRSMYILAKDDKASLEKYTRNKSFTGLFTKKSIENFFSRQINDNKLVLETCERSLKSLQDDIRVVTSEKALGEHLVKIQNIFKLLICSDEYANLNVQGEEIVACRSETGEKVSMSKMSTGQKVCLALAFMFALFLSNVTAPNFIMLDEPVANLDDLHMLNLLDLLRRLALSDTQIFFTTANPDVARLFRRKFSYLEEDFGFYRILDINNSIKIAHEHYTQKQDNPIKVDTLYD